MMSSGILMMLLFFKHVTADSSGTVVTSCEACHGQATCLDSPVERERGDAFQTWSVTCTCQDGFVGDGVTCYDLEFCAKGSCCRQGYRWSSELGCVDVDECSLPDQPCSPPQVCENTPGSFNCLVPPEDDLRSSPGSDSRSVQFQCEGIRCPVGEDCISVGGSSLCADPCQHYSVLNDDWRSTTNNGAANGYHCDTSVNWQGWYRLFLGNTSVQMPERCVESYMCGTEFPLWLPLAHPQLGDGVVQRSVCGHYYYDCCYWRQTPIYVKACYGNYYVYKFVPSTRCNMAYCADVNTMVCSTCGVFDACVSDNETNWRCERKAPELVCGRSLLKVGLPNVYLEAAGLDASSAHLADHRCSAHEDRNGTVWYQVERREGRCGNTLETNTTHAVYSNSLFVYPVDGRNDSRPLSFPFSCVYPLETESSLDMAIRPLPLSDHKVVRVGAKAKASMSLYRDSNYTQPYPAGQPVTLIAGSFLHVGVSVEESEAERFVVVLEDCYTTESPSPDSLPWTYMIQDRCPTNRTQVTVEESGSSLRARFSALLQGDYRYIFLHCSLSLCDQGSSSCIPVCSRRRSRSVSKSIRLKPLTIGPIIWAQSLE
ncbi:uromodulin [Salmo trutta]|uniref:uromodulin n=1 Tax=Salmo trutta TaxID=8032 RepID=UPI001131C450|nr:uromodulin-like [Salmo trutta]